MLSGMIDEGMQGDLGRLAFACDLTPSELVRSCITLLDADSVETWVESTKITPARRIGRPRKNQRRI